MRLLLLLSTASLLSLTEGCCTPECCCPGCTSCTNPVNDRCNSYSCTTYEGNMRGGCATYRGGFNRMQYSSGGAVYNGVVQQGVQIHSTSGGGGGCNCNARPPTVGTHCVCPDGSTGRMTSVVAVNGIGTQVVHKDNCYGYEYCLLGLPGWVTIICSILLLLIFIILLFYCISCLIHFFII